VGKTAFVFPGQGAQEVGMGRDVCEAFESSRRVIDLADELLGFRLSEIIFEGPEDQLRLTANTQPALLTVSVALLEALRERSAVRPDFVAGHSLGEYSALVAAGVLAFEDAVRLVRRRGELMEEAVPAGRGTMAAVLGAEREALEALCRDVSATVGLVELANVNCPGQIVVSGTSEGVGEVVRRGGEAGARRVVPLEVSGPFHCSLMKPAAEKLAAELAAVRFRDADVPVVANVDARPETRGDRWPALLAEQVVSPVLWEDCVRRLLAEGVDTFVEIGPGTVLAGLIRKIDRSVRVVSVNNAEAVRSFDPA